MSALGRQWAVSCFTVEPPGSKQMTSTKYICKDVSLSECKHTQNMVWHSSVVMNFNRQDLLCTRGLAALVLCIKDSGSKDIFPSSWCLGGWGRRILSFQQAWAMEWDLSATPPKKIFPLEVELQKTDWGPEWRVSLSLQSLSANSSKQNGKRWDRDLSSERALVYRWRRSKLS
jgi:hypothetical protein